MTIFFHLLLDKNLEELHTSIFNLLITVYFRACFKKLPRILCFNTMRYTFNMVTMMKEKVNTHFSFPLCLDMSQYMEKNLMGPDKLRGKTPIHVLSFNLLIWLRDSIIRHSKYMNLILHEIKFPEMHCLYQIIIVRILICRCQIFVIISYTCSSLHSERNN